MKNARVIVEDIAIHHRERNEDSLADQIAQRFSSGAFGDDRQQKVAAVAVAVVRVRREVQLFLPRQKHQRFAFVSPVLAVVSVEAKQIGVIANAAGVVQQIGDRDLLSVIGDLGNEFSDVVVEPQFAVCNELDDDRAGELL